ncbi:ABC transporter substrate-binding protein [Agrobacterium sp. 22-226-1]
MTRKYSMALALAIGAASFAGAAQAAQEVRFTCAYDGNGCEILKDILARYEKQHPDVKIVTDVVPYKALLEGLPVQLAGGSGPDFATVTDLGGLNRYYLDLTPYVDAKYWEDNFSNVLKWYRSGPDDKGIYGMHTQLTITGAFINRTLFDQANVAVPGKDATLDDWAKAANAVAKATGTPYPMAIDRSGHRIAGPAISYGAKIFDADGKPILVDEGFTTFVKKFVEWNKDGTMARDVWAGQGGNTYRDAAQEFINGQLVYYYSGSWQTARFDSQVGDAFDWEVVPQPCGGAACTGMPGGTGIVGFKQTKNPKIVADILNFLAQDENYLDFTVRTRNVPANKSVADKGVTYTGATPATQKAMNAWLDQIPGLSPIAYAYQGYKNNRAMFNISVQRITQAIVGESTVDEAMARAKADLEEALKQAK